MKKILLFLAVVMVSVAASAQEQDKGYRGFADLGYGIGVGDYEFGRFSIETSHGYQFNHYIFLGAGLAFQFSEDYATPDMDIPLDTRKKMMDIPVFANFRANFLKKKFSPFIDFKIGYYVNNGGAEYINLSGGLRIATSARQAVNISIGYGTQKLEFEVFKCFTNPGHSMAYSRSPRKLNTEVVAIKIGYEF